MNPALPPELQRLSVGHLQLSRTIRAALAKRAVHTVRDLMDSCDEPEGGIHALSPAKLEIARQALANFLAAMNESGQVNWASFWEVTPPEVDALFCTSAELKRITPQVRAESLELLGLRSKTKLSLDRIDFATLGDLIDAASTGLKAWYAVGPLVITDLHESLRALSAAVQADGSVDWDAYASIRGMSPSSADTQNRPTGRASIRVRLTTLKTRLSPMSPHSAIASVRPSLPRRMLSVAWAIKRVLFLADRVALVNQAAGAFKKHLPDSAPVNLITEKLTEGRIFLSTYPTMIGLIEESHDGQRRFGPGHFDLIIIDEAHRSVFQKYRAIFDYFDSLLVGLTATPKDEVDRNTYGLFELEDGVPTDFYPLEEAVKDKYLVPPKAVAVPLRFQREGINYDDLPEEEKEMWDALDWDEEGGVPDRIEAQAVNKWLFNKDTVDKVLEHVMTRGQKVAGGDQLGKTIIFAKNNDHAEYIAERFNANYPHYKGEFARVITFKTEYAQSLIDSFSNKDKAPHIAISVDMLDTGIDVPEVLNLVFFKLVRSKTKFWQMVGRGTRLCPGVFGPGVDKQFFYIFDYCQNLEYFSQNPDSTEGALGASLGKRLFLARLDLIGELDRPAAQMKEPETQEEYTRKQELRAGLTSRLHEEVSAMNAENFVVRPKRRLVEKYREEPAWRELKLEERQELAANLAGLPNELETEDEEAKRFDLLILNLQLALLRAEPIFARLRDQVRGLAGLLEEQAAIPAVQRQMVLIQEIQTDEWWEHVHLGMLESARRNLRELVKLIEKTKRKPIYTDFEDEMGAESVHALPGFGGNGDFERFRQKTRAFLQQNENHIAVHKLRMNEALTKADVAELERMLAEAGLGSHEDIERAIKESSGLGLFVRGLIGLDRQAAKQALAVFLNHRTLGSAQIEFINLVVDHLTERGVVEAARLYESPFTDIAPRGPDGLFKPAEIEQLFRILDEVREKAGA